MDLTERYKKETGHDAYTGSIPMGHFEFNDGYVEWLESLVESQIDTISPFNTVDGASIGKGPFADYIAQYQSALGVRSNVVNIKIRDKRIIGYVDKKDLEAFITGDPSVLTPVSNWKETFSIKLMDVLGLRAQN